MYYYHGTDTHFKEFDIRYSGIYKDFGAGIYLTENYEHAKSVALWKNGTGAYIYKYNINMKELKQKFRVREFKGVSIEWIKFIIANRKYHMKDSEYDIVIGSTADARAQQIIKEFTLRVSHPTEEEYIQLIKMLKVGIYPNQICLKKSEMISFFNERRVEEERLR